MRIALPPPERAGRFRYQRNSLLALLYSVFGTLREALNPLSLTSYDNGAEIPGEPKAGQCVDHD